MLINITRYCPQCHSSNIVKNGKKYNGPQNYLCKDCRHQFISDYEKTNRGWVSRLVDRAKIMLVRGIGIRDISAVLGMSIKKVLKILTSTKYRIQPKQKHYDTLEVDEFWTYVGNKKNKKWLIYAYHRASGEIVGYVWGKRDLKTAKWLKKRIKMLGITYERIACDRWDSFLAAFEDDRKTVGKAYTVGIEGNHCRLRHRVRRAFRRTCCFSKKLLNHLKAFNMAFFYINYGFV